MNISDKVKQLDSAFDELKNELVAYQQAFMEVQRQSAFSEYDTGLVQKFLEKPYTLKQIRNQLWEITIPKFINFKAGWPARTEGEYVVYRVSQFIDMLTPLPNWLKADLKFTPPPFDGVVNGDKLEITGDAEQAFKTLGGAKIGARRGNTIHLKRRNRFQVMRQLVRMGILPYSLNPVPKEILRTPRGNVVLREKQQRDLETFLQYSSCSLFAPGGAGKTFFGLYLLDILKGEKIVIAPTRDILEQWKVRIQSLIPHVLHEVVLQTYNKNVPNHKFAIAIFDEIQRIPSDTGVRAASIDSICRVGMSATPWREDGQEDLIPALCGIGIGMDWETGKTPSVEIVITGPGEEKYKALKSIVKKPRNGRKTIIFVYRIDIGNKIAKMLNIPFVHGSMGKDRYSVMKNSDVFVASKIADAGVSFDFEQIIDFDWLGGRAEAGQRLLRGQHSNDETSMTVLVSRDEYKRNAERFSAFYALGAKVSVVK